MSELKIGSTLQNGKYKITGVLGQGGFGITYEGIQTGLGRKVAIKEFFMKDFCEREDSSSQVSIVGTAGNRSMVHSFKEKFLREARMIAALEDVPHVVRIYDIFEENGTAYYVMKFLEGGSLASRVKAEGPLSEVRAVACLSKMAEALEHLHAQKIMHLDIKPANVMLHGEDITLIDFGVSKHYDETGNATTATPVARSKGYAPIEQYRQGGIQAFSPETDIYGLGATAWFMLMGHTPPEATELLTQSLPRPAGISDAIWNAISCAMRPAKDDRPHSVKAFMELLNRKEQSGTLDEADDPTNIDAGSFSTQESHAATDAFKASAGQQAESISAPSVTTEPLRSSLLRKLRFPLVFCVALFVGYLIYNFASREEDSPVVTPNSVATQSNGNSASNNGTFTVNGVTFKMVRVEGGTFQMGSSDSEADSDEQPVHSVTLSGYNIGETEVTQALWEAVMGNNPSYFKGANLPVEKVSWNDCQDFIRELNRLTGKTFRLPTEAEWEFAARGGNSSKGYKYSGSDNIGDVAWYSSNSSRQTHEVATKQPNELGLYDMSGNVREWCQDWYGSYSSGSQTNPKGAASGSYSVHRGGSWCDNAGYCRVAYRRRRTLAFRYDYLGLRLAL